MERGDSASGEGVGDGTAGKSVVRVLSTTKLSSVAETEHGSVGSGALVAVTTRGQRPATIRTSKWGRLLGSSSLDSGSESMNSNNNTTAIQRSVSARDHTSGNKDRVQSLSGTGSNTSTNGAALGSGNKVFPKLQKLTSSTTTTPTTVVPPQTTRRDTIEEIAEFEDHEGTKRVAGTNLRKVDLYDSGILHSCDQRLNEASTGSLVLYQRPVVTPAPPGIAAAEYKEIISNIMDFKVDVKLEVQRLNQKVGHMEELLTELLSRFSQTAPVGNSAASSASSQSPPQEAEEGTETQQVAGATQPQKRPARVTSVMTGVPSVSSSAGAGEGTSASGTGIGSIILRKRRSKSRTKAAAPAVPTTTPTNGTSPRTSPTEMTRMLQDQDQGLTAAASALPLSSTSKSDDDKRQFRRSREFL